MNRVLIVMLVVLGVAATSTPQRSAAVDTDAPPIALPAPQTSGGMPLMSAIAARQSQRAFKPDPLTQQHLSDLLWAAWGVTRPESGRRAAPSARNRQSTDVYVVLAEGAYLYDAQVHALVLVATGDLRPLTGSQDFVATAPLNLVYVERMPDEVDENALIWAGSHAGFISENVYLYCASAGLATVVRGWVDREALAPALGLPANHRILLAQSVGHPAD